MKNIFFIKINTTFAIATLFLALLATSVKGQIVYSNTGANTTGFVITYPFGASLTSNGTDLVLNEGGIWDTLPVTVTGNFQLSYQVYNNSGDGDSHVMLLNNGTTGGVGVTNSPQNTDTPSINIVSATDFTNYNQYFFPTASETLATALSHAFPNDTWTQIIVTKFGNILTDNVGGQTIQYNVSGLGLSSSFQIGLGGYATTNLGGAGQLLYSNIVVTEIPEPSCLKLLTIGLVFAL